jgi:hypothetical protein
MTRMRERWREATRCVLAVTIPAVLAASAGGGCAVAPTSRGPGELSESTVEVLGAVIVDLDPGQGTITVKDRETYQTWTIAVVELTQFRSTAGEILEMEDLRIEDLVEVRGRSRVAHLMTADQVMVERRPADAAPMPDGQLRRE